MIKKFEEFVNENYNRRENWTPEEIEQFGSFLTDICGYERSQWRRMQEFITINGYTFEDTMNIFNRLGVAEPPTSDMLSSLKELFDIDANKPMHIKRKKDILNEMSDKYNGGKPLPVVIDIDGKLITGEVYYCEELDAYAKDEDDFMDAVDEGLFLRADEEDILDDDQSNWVDDHWEDINIYKVDLDKEYLDEKSNELSKR